MIYAIEILIIIGLIMLLDKGFKPVYCSGIYAATKVVFMLIATSVVGEFSILAFAIILVKFFIAWVFFFLLDRYRGNIRLLIIVVGLFIL